jgi:hypothetical protein
MEQQTGGFGPWPSDEAPQLGVVGAAEAAEPIEAADAADVAGDAGDEGEAVAEPTEDPASNAGEQADPAWERADARASADAGGPGTAWEVGAPAGGSELESDAWEVDDSDDETEAENDAWAVEDPAGGSELESDAWEVDDSDDETEAENDAWAVEDSAGESELESVGELPDGPTPGGSGLDDAAPDPGPRPKTGEPRVDAAVARLDELAGSPVTEHRAIFEDVHRRLRDVLGELDTREPPEPHNATRSESRAGR